MRKILASLIILTIIFSSFGTVAFAAEPAFTIEYADGTESATASNFKELVETVNKKADGTLITVTMNTDVESTSNVTFNEGTNVVLDLGGNTLDISIRASAISVAGALEVKNGNVTYTGNNYAFWCDPDVTSKASSLTIDNVKVTSNKSGIGTYKSTNNKGAVITIRGGNTEINSAGTTLYTMKDVITYNIYDGLFTSSSTSDQLFQLQAGTFNIYGGTFKQTNIAGDTDWYTIGNKKAYGTSNITGGTFQCDVSKRLGEGYYSNKIGQYEFVVEQKAAAKTEGTISNRYQLTNTDSGYTTADTTYKTLQYALDDTSVDTDVATDFVAPVNPPIVLLANNTEGAVANREVTITKNGYTANVKAGEGYVLKETDTAYIIEEAPEAVTVSSTIKASYEDGNGTKTQRFFANITTLNVAEAGFEVTATVNGVEYVWEIALNEVYNSVIANDVTYNATNYILTGAIGEVPADFDGEFEVKVYTKNYEGQKSYIN